MSALDDWFPYPDFRPNQRKMLETVSETAINGGVLMIDAPTGSGKSSAVSALMSESNGRKILIAVRTISQLNIFLRELELIRQKHGVLKYSYLVGKSSICQIKGVGDVYRLCEGVKSFSTSLMRERAQKGSLIPSNDPVIRRQIDQQDKDHPLLCPYYIRGHSYSNSEDGGLKMVPSSMLNTKAERFINRLVHPDKIHSFFGEICPHDAMMEAAKDADVIVLNFHHLFSDQIREQIYANLEIDERNTLLLIDEAHNCGEVIQKINSVRLSDRDVEQAMNELSVARRKASDADGVAGILHNIMEYMNLIKRLREAEDWFDPSIFEKSVIRGSLYIGLEGVVDDLISISERLRGKNLKEGDFRETAVEKLASFFYCAYRALSEQSYLPVYNRDDEGMVSLFVNNIDPSDKLREIICTHHCAVMISGTLSPIESFKKYYFGNTPGISTLSLPNSFPRENREIICARDITSAYSMRRDPKNLEKIDTYILKFASIKGNLAIYFPSYDMLNTFAERCAGRIRGKEVIIEPREASDANQELKRFLELPASGKSGIIFAVCGGKWSEGLDYRGEMLSGALVLGLPLAPFNNVRRMTNDYFRNKFGREGEFISYTLPAINRALQALGRVLRTPEDHGLLVLAEKRFLEPENRNALPKWMKDEITVTDVNEFGEVVKKWR